MSALYFAISKDQASWFPEPPFFTKRASSQTPGDFFDARVITGVIGRISPARSGNRAAPHSTARTVLERLGGNCRSRFLRPPICQAWPEKSSPDSQRASAERGRSVFFLAPPCAPQTTPPPSCPSLS